MGRESCRGRVGRVGESQHFQGFLASPAEADPGPAPTAPVGPTAINEGLYLQGFSSNLRLAR